MPLVTPQPSDTLVESIGSLSLSAEHNALLPLWRALAIPNSNSNGECFPVFVLFPVHCQMVVLGKLSEFQEKEVFWVCPPVTGTPILC